MSRRKAQQPKFDQSLEARTALQNLALNYSDEEIATMMGLTAGEVRTLLGEIAESLAGRRRDELFGYPPHRDDDSTEG